MSDPFDEPTALRGHLFNREFRFCEKCGCSMQSTVDNSGRCPATLNVISISNILAERKLERCLDELTDRGFTI